MSQPVRKRSVIVVCGCPSFGKTTGAIRAVLNLPLSVRYFFDPDPGEFRQDIGEFADRLKLPPACNEYQCALALAQGWIAFDPHTLFPGELNSAFDEFCRFAWETSLGIDGDKMLVVTDAYRYCTPNFIPDSLRMIVQSGGKRRLSLLIDTQQPQMLNPSIRTCMGEVICFRLQDKGPLEFAEAYGFNPDEVANLDRLQFVARNLDSGGELRGRIPI